MLIGIPIWQGRVSPVFDVAQHLAVAHMDEKRLVRMDELPLPGGDPLARVRLIEAHRIEILLCGAISRYLQRMLQRSGVSVWPCLCGEVQHVISAFTDNQLLLRGLVMPGCDGRTGGGGCNHGRRRQMRHRRGQQINNQERQQQ